eukprot:TRINITY_DN6072_c3_g1_i3.p1 TRINITY_DN6072_c3_g1~~TRINITY_DN6072_c3_g1_i3.p1  ORF type:complete len:479 (+),score=184.49 TRINITY_DN6072_c3_g1_i3:349-1785(+)
MMAGGEWHDSNQVLACYEELVGKPMQKVAAELNLGTPRELIKAAERFKNAQQAQQQSPPQNQQPQQQQQQQQQQQPHHHQPPQQQRDQYQQQQQPYKQQQQPQPCPQGPPAAAAAPPRVKLLCTAEAADRVEQAVRSAGGWDAHLAQVGNAYQMRFGERLKDAAARDGFASAGGLVAHVAELRGARFTGGPGPSLAPDSCMDSFGGAPQQRARSSEGEAAEQHAARGGATRHSDPREATDASGGNKDSIVLRVRTALQGIWTTPPEELAATYRNMYGESIAQVAQDFGFKHIVDLVDYVAEKSGRQYYGAVLGERPVDPSLYRKSEQCKFFASNKHCYYSDDQCRFAHPRAPPAAGSSAAAQYEPPPLATAQQEAGANAASPRRICWRTPVGRWLSDNGLGMYAEKCAEWGYDDMEDLRALARAGGAEYEGLISSPGHRAKLRRLLDAPAEPARGRAPAAPAPAAPARDDYDWIWSGQ